MYTGRRWQEYLCPSTVDEAIVALASYRGRARVVSGGTDLLLDLHHGTIVADCLVDITNIDRLKQLELVNDQVVIGAAVTHGEAAASSLIRDHAAALAQATGQMGSPQIRNQATVMGNVIRALPAADAAVALAALDAEVEIACSEGTRWQRIESLYTGIGSCSVDSRYELATRLRFRALGTREGSAFLRLVRRNSLALPIVNAAAVVGVDAGHFASARLAVAPVAPAPYRPTEAEEYLKGKPASREVIEGAARLAAQDAHPRSNWSRGSREYRCQMVEVLVRRALENALAAAQGRRVDRGA